MADRSTGRASDQFNLRLPEGMREQIAEVARKSGRSMNSEIVHRLANSLENPSFADMSLGLGDDLDVALMMAAGQNGRSLQAEMIERLQQSLLPTSTLISELEDRAWEARRRYDDLMRLHMQLTPEERRILQERAEFSEIASKIKISSKDIGQFVQLNTIGRRGRIILDAPLRAAEPIMGKDATSKELLAVADDLKRD